MKKLITVLLLAISTTACAGGYHHRGHGGHGHAGWIAPLIGGVVLGAIISQPSQAQQPIVVHPPLINYYPGVEYYTCLVQVRDPHTGVIRNEPATCARY